MSEASRRIRWMLLVAPPLATYGISQFVFLALLIALLVRGRWSSFLALSAACMVWNVASIAWMCWARSRAEPIEREGIGLS